MQHDLPHTRLTAADVERLFSEPTEDVRTQIAFKVASQFDNVVLMPRERELAEEILGCLVLDVSVSVRQSLSSALSDMPNAPRDIVLQLARDIDDEVAQPVLENSSAFSDADLAELVLAVSAKRQCLIAGRTDIGGEASGAIAGHGDRSAVLVLVCNEGVVLRPDVFETIIERYGDDEAIVDPMARRDDLPICLVERVVTLVSSNLRLYLVERHGIDARTARVLEDQARERALIELMGDAVGGDLDSFLVRLVETERLTPSLLLRGVCAGRIEFVEKGFAFLTSIPAERANRLIHDVGPLGFRALHARSAMPELYYPAFRAALDVLLELEKEHVTPGKAELAAMMIARMEPLYREVEAHNLDLLLDRLTRTACSAPWMIRAA